MAAEPLGPWSGTYHPDYNLTIYQNGDPSRRVTGVNLRSATSIQTQKSLDDISGTFTIVLKDRRAQGVVKPMDVVKIRLKGHNQGWGTVLIGVVDTVEPVGQSGNPYSAQADMQIKGRCAAKYLQINSMFLPAWDPQANLPTALIFGKGDSSNKLGTTINAYTPRAIFGYIFDNFVVGLRNRVGLSGTPNARFWLSRTNRFEWVRDASRKVFQIPFVQFDEDTTDTALTRLVVQGFTEGWVDEVGNIVYRQPAWDAPVSWNLHTGGLVDWDLPETDTSMATYVEVFPSALPALPSGVAQAMMAGRAPIPSDYVTGLKKSGFKSIATSDFIIDTDSRGKVTSKGRQNWYYQKQKTYGLRPYQISSPLLASREQAQAQAEGLLRFMLRWDKSGSLVIPGEPNVRLGQTLHAHGPLEDQNITRTYYVQGISQEYIEGDHYTTTISVSHGRDPGDPSWQDMVLPNFSPSQLANLGGLLNPKPAGGGGGGGAVGGMGGKAVTGFANPFPGGWIRNRLDNGYDGTFHGMIVAPFPGRIVFHGTGIPTWGGYMTIQADGPIGLPTRTLYFAEGCECIHPNGTHLNAGDPMCRAIPSPYGNAYHTTPDGSGQIEWGIAQEPSGVGDRTDPYTYIASDRAGVVLNFNKWLHTTLGVDPSTDTGDAGHG